MTLISSISGIRGTIGGEPGKNLTPLDIVRFTSAYGMMLRQQVEGQKGKVVIGRDGRISGNLVSQLVAGSLQSIGLDVVDLGLSTTPTVEMAVEMEEATGGIILTASHNPKQWNALKLLNNKGEFISQAQGEQVLAIAEKEEFDFVKIEDIGTYSENDTYLDKHIEAILALPLVNKEAIAEKKYRIAVDGINSSGSIAVPKLLNALGVEDVFIINEEPNGAFAHDPEPLPANLSGLSSLVTKENAHLGFAVDPDVDRLAIVSEDGEMFGEEFTLVAIADYILKHNPGATVSNLSSSIALREISKKHKCEYAASKVGEVNVVAKMKEIGAVIGGEGNGGIIYPELHYGRDALVGIALFLSHLATSKKYCSLLRATYPSLVMSKQKIKLEEGIDVQNVLNKIVNKYDKNPTNLEDGVKIFFSDTEWVHLRRSNTEPVVRIISEAESEVVASNLANKLIQDIGDAVNGEI